MDGGVSKVRLAALLLAAPLAAQTWHIAQEPMQIFAGFGPAATAVPTVKESLPVRLRITASRQPLATLRAIARAIPEGAALYAVQVCNICAVPVVIDSGAVEQALEGRGIAITAAPLIPATLERSRGIGRSALARTVDVLTIAGPIALSLAAGGVVQLNGWQVAAVSSLSTGLQVLDNATKAERSIAAPSLGTMLGDTHKMALAPGECSGRKMVMASYTRGQSATVVIEE
jgi:hypothetical protein